MINITTRISLSKTSKKIIKTHIRKQPYSSKTWDVINKAVKNEISKKLLFNQGPYCVYCERSFLREKIEIDHFAHKGDYSQFTFTTINLFYSCNFCNSLVKNQRSTIFELPHVNYRNCTFLIVHPFLNNPDDEILFKDPERVDIDWDQCTDLGKDTITFWKWDEQEMTMFRAQMATIRRLHPLTSEAERDLINKIIAYK